jgi:predicted DNA-binding transcriptional regulator AlpA
MAARLPDPRERPVVELWPTAGQALGLSRPTTYRLAASGAFPVPARRIGSRWKVVTQDLLDWLSIPAQEGMRSHATSDDARAG